MGIIITIYLQIMGFLKQKSKLLFFIQSLWIWIITAFNNGGMDYEAYLGLYNVFSKSYGLNFFQGGTLYRNGAYIFNKLSLSFVEYNFFITSIAVVLMINLIYKKSKAPCYVLSCYMCTVFFNNVIQKRNFLAEVCILYAVNFLIEKGKNYRIKSFVLIFIAYQFHTISIFYLLLFLVNIFKIRNLKYIVYTISIICFFFITSIGSIIIKTLGKFYSKVIVYIQVSQIELYKVLFFVIFYHLIVMYVFLYFSNQTKYNKKTNMLRKINYVFLLFIPLYNYNSVFLRFYHNIYISLFIYISNCDRKMNFIEKLFVFYLWIFFIVYYFIIGKYGYYELVAPLFNENILLRGIKII